MAFNPGVNSIVTGIPNDRNPETSIESMYIIDNVNQLDCYVQGNKLEYFMRVINASLGLYRV